MLRSLLIASICLLASPALAQVHKSTSNLPVPHLDLSRFAGTWHEIAHLPKSFQRKCVGSSTISYTLLQDDTLEIENRCHDKDGDLVTTNATARSVTGRSGALEVHLAPRWTSWAPVTWSDYWVVELDPEYQWAVVGGGGRKHLWILSRSPTMSQALFDKLCEQAEARGYDLKELIITAPLS